MKNTKSKLTYAIPYILARQTTRFDVLIGIDPGTKTGVAVKKHGQWILIKTMGILDAIETVETLCKENKVFVKIEDARLRRHFGNTGKEKWQGAGSIKRDCRIWEKKLEQLKVQYEMVHPKHVKETTAEYFKAITNWNGTTSKHSREAAWMII